MQRRIREYAASRPGDPWVSGRGWFYGAFPGGLPHRGLLDAVVPDRPRLHAGLRRPHGVGELRRALEAAGITRETPDPANGVIVRDEGGEATGVLKEAAMGLVRRLVPPPTGEDLYRALKLRLDQAASYGLTSVQNASFPAAEMPVFDRVIAEGGLKVRFYWAIPFLKDLSAEDLARWKALRDKHTGPLFKFGAAKGMVDGVVESKTAAMFEPYVGGGGSGHANWTQQDLDHTAAVYDREGFQIFLHAIGDRAIHMALNAFEHAARVNGTTGRRHRVEHVEVPRLSDIPRFKALGVVASTQGLFANPDQNTLEVYAAVLGPEREALAMPFKLLDDAGAVQAFGSDWPVFPMEPLRGLYAAVARRTPEGSPPGGWQPHLRISAGSGAAPFHGGRRLRELRGRAQGHAGPGKAGRPRGVVRGHPGPAGGADPPRQGPPDRDGRPRHVPGAGVPVSAFAGKSIIVTGASVRHRPRALPRPGRRSGPGSRWPPGMPRAWRRWRRSAARWARRRWSSPRTSPPRRPAATWSAARSGAFGGAGRAGQQRGGGHDGPLRPGRRPADLRDLMRVNYLGCVYPTHYALPHLEKSRGLIVVMASLAGLTGVPTRTGYAASKHAVFGFFDSLRIELEGTGVGVTMIAPDFVLSEIHRRHAGPTASRWGRAPCRSRGS